MKKCYKCKQTKAFSDFNKNQSRCRECDRIKNKLYRETHREYFRQKSKERYDPSLNPVRYAANKEDYLHRREEYSKSIRGRLICLLYSAKTRAEKNGLVYSLDIEWALELYNKQSGCCLLTGIKLEFDSKRGGDRIRKPFSPSLDRIDSTKGYEKNNVRLVCTFVNLALNNFGEAIFKQVAEAYMSKLYR